MNKEVQQLLTNYPQIKQEGLDLWGTIEDLSNWLLSKTRYSKGVCGGRVIDMEPKEILAEIGRIEHGVF
jgi:hypothetical protein